MSGNFKEIIDAQNDLRKFWENSLPYRFCSSLPLPASMKKFCFRRVNDIFETVAEIQVIALLVYAIWAKKGYYGASWRQHQKTSFIADVKEIVDQHNFDEMIVLVFPRTYALYQLFNTPWILLKRRTEKIRGGISWLINADHKKPFQVLFGASPADAARSYRIRDLPHNDPFTSKFAYNTVRFHFYTSLEKGKSEKKETPYISVDVTVEKKGVNLSRLRKQWGLDSLAIIANVEPFRIIFTPVDEDWLSVMAAYDLSNQFTTPIRVYEPRVSPLTSLTRKLHDNCYPTAHGLSAFPKLALGFTNDEPEYYNKLSVLYGPQNAERYRNVARFTRPINFWTIEALWLVTPYILAPIVLPVFIGYNIPFIVIDVTRFLAKAVCSTSVSLGKFLSVTAQTSFVTMQTTAYHSSTMVQAALIWFVITCLDAISATIKFLWSCESKHLMIGALLIWGALAEIRSFQA